MFFFLVLCTDTGRGKELEGRAHRAAAYLLFGEHQGLETVPRLFGQPCGAVEGDSSGTATPWARSNQARC